MIKNLQNYKQTNKKTEIFPPKKLWDISNKETNYIET